MKEMVVNMLTGKWAEVYKKELKCDLFMSWKELKGQLVPGGYKASNRCVLRPLYVVAMVFKMDAVVSLSGCYSVPSCYMAVKI